MEAGSEPSERHGDEVLIQPLQTMIPASDWPRCATCDQLPVDGDPPALGLRGTRTSG